MLRSFCSFLLLWSFFEMTGQSPDLYDPGRITQISLSFTEEDWEYPLHYYYSLQKGNRHTGNASINGIEFDSVGVRFKGFSSYRRSFAKNPLNIKLDHLDKSAQYNGFETLKLSNGNLDPSWLREILGYSIARKYMAAPKSNYAEVYVNERYYGLFGNTEDVNGRFATQHFNADRKTAIIKGNSPLGPFGGRRSSLEYLGKDTSLYFKSYELENDYGWEKLVRMIYILNNEPERIEEVLNMDLAIWMLAFNNVLVNLDSYSDFQQNYYLILDRHNRFNFVLWDLNLAFDGLGKPAGVIMQHDYDPFAYRNNKRYPLIRLVLNDPRYRKKYIAHARTILEENFANGSYKKEADNYRRLIDESVRKDTNWVFGYDAFQQNYHDTYISKNPHPFPYPGITEFVNARTEFLQQHPAFKEAPPSISEVEVTVSNHTPDSSTLVITARIANGKWAEIGFRNHSSQTFKKMPMSDNGKNGDGKAGDGVFGAVIPWDGIQSQYYIYAENREAGMFSPERAEYEYHRYDGR